MNPDASPIIPEETSAEKLPKINLPPKPVLASTVINTPATSGDQPPAIPFTPTDTKPSASNSSNEVEKTDLAIKTQKQFSVGLPLAIVAMIVAFLAFFLQLRIFLF